MRCPVCFTKLSEHDGEIRHGDTAQIKCSQCGRFSVTGSAYQMLSIEDGDSSRFGPRGSRRRANLSAWLRDQNRSELLTADLEKLGAIQSPTFHEKANKLLINLEKRTRYAGDYVTIKEQDWIAITWSLHYKELSEILCYLRDIDRVSVNVANGVIRDTVIQGSGVNTKITPKGWEHLEKLAEVNPDSNQIFIAMWFDSSLNEILSNGFTPAIEQDAHYEALRIDGKEHANKIDDEIIAEIRRSRLVVADFTGHRGGVYFEAGYAMGLGLPVIWTCRKDDLENLHFDIRQYNCIDWIDSNDLRKRLSNRIKALIGQGNYHRNTE